MTQPGNRQLVILARHADGGVEEVPGERLGDIGPLIRDSGTLLWVSSAAPSEEDIAAFGGEFGLHQLALEDLRKQEQRPKLDSYGSQHMIVTYEVAPGNEVALSEIHLFVGPDWLLSVHWMPTPELDGARGRFASGQDGRIDTVGELLYTVLDAAVDSYFPALDAISERIDTLEDQVLEGNADREELREILFLKRRLLELRRVLGPMRDTANSLLRRDIEVVTPETIPYYQDLYDHLVRVIDQLDLYRDLLAAVLDARLAVVSNSLNAIMKRLTAMTVLLMVPTLIAGIYGMNFRVMPEIEWALGYPFAIGVMLASAAIAGFFFWRRGWF
ncbi:MAG: magnesium/cobalt transporter CorA [Candidatus Limnocylindria bacterium]